MSRILSIAALFIMAALLMASVPPNVSYRLVSWDSFLFEGALQNPPPPTPTAGATSGGSCSSAFTYQFYRSDANLSGETALSAVSTRYKPASGSSNIVNLAFGSFPNNASAIHLWFSRSDDEYSTIYACGTGGVITDVTSGVSASCLCSTSSVATKPTSNTTSNLYNQYSVTSPTSVYFARPSVKVVEVCPIGCKYQTLNAACAAETSTATNPIRFYIHAATYAAADTMCSGQDHASFVGDGIGVTTLQSLDHGYGFDYTSTDCVATPFACEGALNLGTSTNIEVANISLKGTRGIYWAANTTGGGESYIHDTELNGTLTTNGDEDSILIDSPAAGSRFTFANNIARTNGDGLTIDNIQDDTTSVYSSNNRLFIDNSTNLIVQDGMWALRSIPCLFVSTGDQIRAIGRKPTATDANAIYGFQFDGNPRTAGKSCSGSGVATINSASIYVESKATAGTSAARAISVGSNATELGTLNVNGTNAQAVSNDAGTGISYGIDLANTTSVVNVGGGYYRASGGTNVFDLNSVANASLNIFPSVNYLTRRGNETVAPLAELNVTSNSKGITLSASDANSSMLVVKNTDAVNDEGSPYLNFRSSAVSPENYYVSVGNTGTLTFWDGSFNPRFQLTQTGILSTQGDLRALADGSNLYLGNGGNNDQNQIFFNATNSLSIKWRSSTKRWEMSGNVAMSIGQGSDLSVGSCVAGDVAYDTGGATKEYCFCFVTNTWGCWKPDGTFTANGPAD